MSEEILLSVPGMACRSCVSKIENALKQHVNVEELSIDLDRKMVVVSAETPISELISLISSVGYAAERID
jgi:Cu+-exporting ATPase